MNVNDYKCIIWAIDEAIDLIDTSRIYEEQKTRALDLLSETRGEVVNALVYKTPVFDDDLRECRRVITENSDIVKAVQAIDDAIRRINKRC